MMPPVQFASTPPQGGNMPTVESVTTTTTVAKTEPISSPTPMPYGFMNRCGKPVCSPMFGMNALAMQYPMMNPYAMGVPPTTGFIPRTTNPYVTPYYPGTNPGSYGPITTTPYYPGTNTGTYGPITTTPVITTNPTTSPYVNPTFYGTPQQQYTPIPSTRDRIGRTA